MDFTKVFNDDEGVEDIPDAVYQLLASCDLDYTFSDKCVRTVDDDSRTIFEVGIEEEGENLNDAPYLTHDYRYMIEAMESFKKGDMEKANEGFCRLMNDVPEVSSITDDTRRDPVSRAETNVEMCAFNTKDFEAEVQGSGYEGMAFLNPSVGTVKRYTQIYPKSSIPIYITEVDGNYIRRITNLSDSLGFVYPILTDVDKLPDRYVYYMGFRADKIFEYNVLRLEAGLSTLEYIGFVPNLLAMACANVDIVSYAEYDNRFVYVRKDEEIVVNMMPHILRTRVDVLTHQYSKLKFYKRSQGILHDMVSSMRWWVDVPIIKARPMAVDIWVPRYSGPIDKRKDGFFIDGKCVVNDMGERVYDAWMQPDNLADHRYMSGDYHGAIYDAGRVTRVSQVDNYVDKLRGSGVPGTVKIRRRSGVPGARKRRKFPPKNAGVYYDDSTTYIEDAEGKIRMRENRNGNVRCGKKKYNKEIVSQYVMTVLSAIEYTGDRLEMYGLKYVDMTKEALSLSNPLVEGNDLSFGGDMVSAALI